jgi:hypothetical protein
MVPWEDDPASKSSMDYLVDIGADIAEYLSYVKTLHRFQSNQRLDWAQLKTQVSNSFKGLNTWWRRWEVERLQAAIEVPSRHLTSNPIFRTLLEYDTLETAYEVCLYNTMRILLLHLWNTLQLFPNSTPSMGTDIVLDMPNQMVLLGISSNATGLACEILRSLRYCYGKSRRFLFTFSFLFIQEVAYGCFDEGSKEAKWMTTQDWAELINIDDVQDANLLKRLVPEGKLKLIP